MCVRVFDAVLLNGVFGYGIDKESDMNRAIQAVARISDQRDIVNRWNTRKKHPDPIELDAVSAYFCRENVLPLPVRKIFPDMDHR